MAQRVAGVVMILSLVALLRPAPTDGAFGIGDIVYDPTVWAEAFTTAVNTTAMLKNQVADLASLSNLGAFVNIAASAQRLLAHTQRLAGVLKGRNAQWAGLMDMGHFTNMDPQDLPEALEIWNQQASGLMGTCALESMQAQEILAEVGDTLQDISSFVGGIAALSGTVQGLQTLAGTMASASAEVMRLSTLAGTFHQAMVNDKLLLSVNEQVSGLLARERLRDWPMGPYTPEGN